MDNQQVRRSLKLAWLAGIVDGEGSITVNRTATGTFDPLVSITNQDPYIFEQCVEIINDCGVGCYMPKLYDPQKNGCRYVRVSGFKRVGALLEQLTPFLRSKQYEAQLLQRYIDSRTSRNLKGLPRGTKLTLTPHEVELLAELRAMKKNRNLRDYTPNPDWLSGEDIVQAA